MKYAIAFRKHFGPIQSSLTLCAKERGIDVLIGNPKNMAVNHSWDDYDALLWFDNNPPMLETSAKIFWWMCDLRDTQALAGTTTTASYIGLCNKMFLSEYADFYGIPSFYVPQCGNDTPTGKSGREITWDVLFLGHTGKPENLPLSQDEKTTRKQILARNFHWNRMPTISAMRRGNLNVQIFSKEGATLDSKWLYQNTPVNLSVSLPATSYTSNRMYNILAAGGFCLTAWFPGIEDMFENHKHLVWFTSYGEAMSLAKRYLAKPDERDKIAKAGHAEYLAKHTAAHRVDTMLEAMS